MTLEIIWEDGGVVRKFSGVVTTDDIQRSVEIVHDDARFLALRYSINDFLSATSVDVSKAALASAVLRTIGDSKSNSKVLVAIVATSSSVKDLAGFYASPSYMPYPAQIFDTVAEARHWIERR